MFLFFEFRNLASFLAFPVLCCLLFFLCISMVLLETKQWLSGLYYQLGSWGPESLQEVTTVPERTICRTPNPKCFN